jgi:hypothetical protein
VSDIEIINDGTMVGLKPVSDAGKQWMENNVQAEGWQYLGSVLYVDQRTAGPIIEGAAADGLEIG